MKKICFLINILLFSISGASQTNWKIDTALSKATFIIGGPFGSKVEGRFSPPKGTWQFDPSALSKSSFDVSIDVSSLDTENKKRDSHLKKEDYFNVVKYSKMYFTTSKIEKTATGFVATGDLKIKDKSRSIKIPFNFSSKDNRGTFNSNLSINRLDYSVGTSSMLMGDNVKISIEISALK